MAHITTMHDGITQHKTDEWDSMTCITTMHDGMAQHGMARDNMTHIATMHDGAWNGMLRNEIT
jgi:hypothetical protein